MTFVPLLAAAGASPSLGYGDYLRFSELLLDRYGLHFSASRRADLERGVRRAFAASTCASLDEYYHLLQDPKDGAVEIDRLINAVTINETHFFRDASQFDALYNHVLPQLIERKRPLRILRIWSAGCASGEEPYSIAMLLRELLPDLDEWSITILGSDVNTEALDRACQAVYGEWAFREERARQCRLRYFRPQGNRYELIPEVRRMVTFARLNLAEDKYPAYETNTTFMDLILCRNVMIYFTGPVTNAVIERFYKALLDGGWLVVGHSEHSLVTYRRFQAHNLPHTILYQRTGHPTAPPLEWDWLTAPPTGSGPPPLPVSAPAPAPIEVQPATPVGDGPCTHPSQEVDPLERAREFLDYGHSEEARDLLLGLVKTAPGHAPACALLGQAYANLGCWLEAEHWCRQAVRLDKLALSAWYTLALVLQHQGKLDQAIDAMKKVVYIDRNYVLGHFGLAGLYHSSGQLAPAQKSLANAHRLLDVHAADELIPDSGGLTVGRLRETVTRQQQQWGEAK
jgi:chemotaxis protein methyltransferase CheR